jgi:hypothetical protein
MRNPSKNTLKKLKKILPQKDSFSYPPNWVYHALPHVRFAKNSKRFVFIKLKLRRYAKK